MQRLAPKAGRNFQKAKGAKAMIIPATANHFAYCQRTLDVRAAWHTYKQIQVRGNPAALHPDDHTAMLGMISQELHPPVAEAHAKLVVFTMRQLGHRLDMRDYHCLFFIHLHNSRHDKIMHLLHTMRAVDNLLPDVKSYNFAMASCLAATSPTRVIKELQILWDNCLRDNPGTRFVNPDPWAFILEAHAKNRTHHKAIEIYNRLKDDQDQLDTVVHLAAIRVLGSANRLHDALDIYEEHFCADKFLAMYDAIIEASISANDLSVAEKYWKELLLDCASLGASLRLVSSLSRSVHPFAKTISRMISFYAKMDMHSEIDLLFNYHWFTILPLDHSTIETVVWSKIHTEKYHEAYQMYVVQMLRRGYMPTVQLRDRIAELKAQGVLNWTANTQEDDLQSGEPAFCT